MCRPVWQNARVRTAPALTRGCQRARVLSRLSTRTFTREAWRQVTSRAAQWQEVPQPPIKMPSAQCVSVGKGGLVLTCMRARKYRQEPVHARMHRHTRTNHPPARTHAHAHAHTRAHTHTQVLATPRSLVKFQTPAPTLKRASSDPGQLQTGTMYDVLKGMREASGLESVRQSGAS